MKKTYILIFLLCTGTTQSSIEQFTQALKAIQNTNNSNNKLSGSYKEHRDETLNTIPIPPNLELLDRRDRNKTPKKELPNRTIKNESIKPSLGKKPSGQELAEQSKKLKPPSQPKEIAQKPLNDIEKALQEKFALARDNDDENDTDNDDNDTDFE